MKSSTTVAPLLALFVVVAALIFADPLPIHHAAAGLVDGKGLETETQQGKLLVDAGAGLKFETRTAAFNLIYGRSLRDGTGVLMGYVEKILW